MHFYIVSPLGGKSPLEPKSLGRFVADQSVLKRKRSNIYATARKY